MNFASAWGVAFQIGPLTVRWYGIIICCAMLIASVANVVFNGISGTGNTQAALLLETITIIIYGSYIIFIGMWLKAPIEICFTIEIVYYSLLLITSYIYLKKAKWQNKKI